MFLVWVRQVCRKNFSVFAVLCLALCIVGCADEGFDTMTGIRFGVRSSDIAAIVALEQGYFKEIFEDENLHADVEMILCADSAEAVDSIGSNFSDFAFSDDVSCITALADGLDAEIIGMGQTDPLIASRSFSMEHSDMTAAILKAVSMGAAYTAANPEDASRIVSEFTGEYISIAAAADYSVRLTSDKINSLVETTEDMITSGDIDTSDPSQMLQSAQDILGFINNSYAD